MKQIERHRLNNNWEFARKLWKYQKIEHNLRDWALQLMDTMDKAGMCSYMERTIYLSSIFMRGHNCNYSKVKKTLLHEIGHALTPGHGHGEGWKQKCKQLGGDSRLGVTMVLPGMSWAVSCPRCKWRQEYSTKPHGTGRMVCGKCRAPVRVKYIH